MITEVKVLLDGLEEILLFPKAEFIMVRLVIHVDPLVFLGELLVFIHFAMMNSKGLGLAVGIHIRRSAFAPCVLSFDGNAALRAHHVLHKEGHLTHHGAPPCLIPPNTSVLKCHLQVPVIDFILGDIIRKPRPQARHPNWPGTGHLAHHVDVVHTTVHDRRDRGNKVPMGLPGRA